MPFDAAVEQAGAGHDDPIRKWIGDDRVAVVLDRDLDAAVLAAAHGMVGPAVAERQLVGRQTRAPAPAAGGPCRSRTREPCRGRRRGPGRPGPRPPDPRGRWRRTPRQGPSPGSHRRWFRPGRSPAGTRRRPGGWRCWPSSRSRSRRSAGHRCRGCEAGPQRRSPGRGRRARDARGRGRSARRRRARSTHHRASHRDRAGGVTRRRVSTPSTATTFR